MRRNLKKQTPVFLLSLSPSVPNIHHSLRNKFNSSFGNLTQKAPKDKELRFKAFLKWLIEYNFNRPHQSLAYLALVEYIEKELAKICSPVLPMWSASITCDLVQIDR